MSRPPAARLVVLISGNGSNLQAILDACAAGELNARVVAVISNRPEAYGLQRAAQGSVETRVLERTPGTPREEYDRTLANLVAGYHPDFIILAGWMRILTRDFLSRFPDQVINLHPALPGTFPGTHAIERAFQAYQRGEIRQTGVMVHRVPDEAVDAGPVLAQQAVLIEPEDSLESLEARMHLVEHHLLVHSLAQLIDQ